MLDAIRKHSASILVKLLFGLLIISFGAWGIGDMIRGRVSVTKVATVGDREIGPNEFTTELQREQARLAPLFGGELDRERARQIGLVDGVLNSMIERTLLELAARDLGVAISDKLVRRSVDEAPAFRGPLGTFDRLRFNEVLQRNRLSEDGYLKLLRADLARGQLIEALEPGAPSPMVLTDPIYRYRHEKRTAEAVVVTDSSIADVAEPGEDALAAFHKDNAQLFTAPEYRALTVVNMRAEDLAKEIQVPEERIREAFDVRRDEFGRPERRHLLQVVTATEADAKRAHGMLVAGRPIAEVANEVAGLAPDAVDLGLLRRDDVLPELAEAAFSLAKGQISGVVASPLGWHVLQVSEIEPAHEATLAEVHDELRASVAHEMALDGLFGMANRFEDILGGGATLQEAAAKMNVPMTAFEAVDATGRDRAGRPVAGLPQGPTFLETAFATAEGSDSPLTESGQDAYFVVRVDRVTPAALRPLDDVRDKAVAAWKAEERRKGAEARAKAAMEGMGAGIAAAAAGSGGTVLAPPPFGRGGQEVAAELPPSLVGQLFKAKPGEAFMARRADGYVVARLKEIVPADPAVDKDGLADLRRQLADALRADILVQYTQALREQYKVVVDRRAVDQLF